MPESIEKNLENAETEEKREANTCIALGAGVGALGAASAVVAGATCPLCVFIAPGLVGVGMFKRWKLKRAERRNKTSASS